MCSQKKMKTIRGRHISFQELKDIVGSKDKTKEDKRKAFVDFFGKRKTEDDG